MNLGKIITSLTRIGSDIATVQSRLADIVKRFNSLKSNVKLKAFLDQNPDIKADVDGISVDLRDGQNAIDDLRNITK